ncbi:MAG: hypothetical protein QME63_08505 [Actinomycetota bacterium]|nr:hypothetical protein [Actinomycetota bacterium]
MRFRIALDDDLHHLGAAVEKENVLWRDMLIILYDIDTLQERNARSSYATRCSLRN